MKSSKVLPAIYQTPNLDEGNLEALLYQSLLGRSNNWRRSGDVLTEDIALDKPGQPHSQFVVDEFLCWNGENLCDEY
jgi:hypothetical protein